jgi:peptide-methionine (S)-S-oxide reductase
MVAPEDIRMLRPSLFAAAVLLPALAVLPASGAEPAVKIDPPVMVSTAPAGDGLQVAVRAGGSFWGIQAVYQHVKGVTNAVSGYAGGNKQDADYETVSSGRTGHAEAVQVTFDPKVVSYGQILQVFFSVAHNPTQLNFQGPDHGRQYRSEIFPQDAAQRQIAKAYIAQLDLAKSFAQPIVTKTDTMKAAFYPAEAYHQDYALRHPNQPYIVYNDAPKVENLKQMFPDLWRDTPVTVAQAEAKGN